MINHTVKVKDHYKNSNVVDLELTRQKAIACFCTECLGFEGNPRSKDPRFGCTAYMCPLFPFRAKTLCMNVDGRPLKDGERTGFIDERVDKTPQTVASEGNSPL